MPSDQIRDTPKLLVDAIAGLSRALGQGVQNLTLEARDELIAGLNEAALQVTEELAPANQRRTKAERTKAELIQAAMRVISEKGYEAASVTDIAQEAGFTKGALYTHFSNKEDLFLSMLREFTQGDDAIVDVAQYQNLHAEPADRVLSLEAYLYGIRHPEAREIVAEIGRNQLDRLAANVRRARGEHGIGSPDDPPTQQDQDIAFALAATDLLGGIMLAADFDFSAGESRLSGVMQRVHEYLLSWPLIDHPQDPLDD